MFWFGVSYAGVTLRLGEVWTAAGLLLFMPDMKAGRKRWHFMAPKTRRPSGAGWKNMYPLVMSK